MAPSGVHLGHKAPLYRLATVPHSSVHNRFRAALYGASRTEHWSLPILRADTNDRHVDNF